MQFLKYLNETETFGQPDKVVSPTNADELLELLKTIAKDSAKFLQHNVTPFYRGVQDYTDRAPLPITKMPQPVNRRSLGSSKAKTDLYNALANDAFGIKNWRATSYFITSERSFARSFARNVGSVCLTFPCGDYSGVFSPMIADIYDEFSSTIAWTAAKRINLGATAMTIYIDDWCKGIRDERTNKAYAAILEVFKEMYQNSQDFSAVCLDGQEVAVWEGDGYWLIPTSLIQSVDFINMLGDIGAIDINVSGTTTDQLLKFIRTL